MSRAFAVVVVAAVLLCTISARGATIDGFKPSPYFEEQTLELTPDDGVRVVVNAPGDFDPARPTQLVVFALPNGNTIEQTLGCVTTPGMDWHFDIQHVAAQTRMVRRTMSDQNVVVAAVGADTKSWPAWRGKRPDAPSRIRKIVDAIAAKVPGKPLQIALTCHSGGGAFLFSFIDGGDAIPANVNRIAWLDAVYAYDDAEHHHGDKLIAWLKGDDSRTMVVISYDDRNITLNGKKVVSDTGGTYRASHRMIDRFNRDVPLAESRQGDFARFVGLDGRVTFLIHPNPEVKILHTVLVERNGLIEALTLSTPAQDKWGGEFWGPRAYTSLIQPAPATRPSKPTTTKASPVRWSATIQIPPRPANAPGGKAFAESIADLPPKAREAAVVQEITRGNIPDFLRKLRPVTTMSGGHTCEVQVMPDYLAIGSDDDFLRMPMTPASAMMIADAFGFSLTTTKLADAIYEQADVKLEPKPLTEHRDAVQTFAQHNAIIEEQRAGKKLGLLVAGIKKDVVITNKLTEKPNKVAIYGWHKPDGKPIQPLYTGHVDWYVDYSHGIRLVSRTETLDGKEVDLFDVLADPQTCAILGEDQPITRGAATYDASRE
jgi:hypothetical protein